MRPSPRKVAVGRRDGSRGGDYNLCLATSGCVDEVWGSSSPSLCMCMLRRWEAPRWKYSVIVLKLIDLRSEVRGIITDADTHGSGFSSHP